jgi:hypothetical protein
MQAGITGPVCESPQYNESLLVFRAPHARAHVRALAVPPGDVTTGPVLGLFVVDAVPAAPPPPTPQVLPSLLAVR